MMNVMFTQRGSGRGSAASRARPLGRVVAGAWALAAAMALTACGGASPSPSASPSESVAPSASESPSASPTPSDPYAALSLEQRVGQLFIVGTPADRADGATLDAVTSRHAGGIFLHGRSQGGVDATAAVVQSFTALPAPVPLWVATDQEGGKVQVLQGPGFDPMPSALTQAGRTPEALRGEAGRWGSQLRAAGVNLNLAPVADMLTSPQTMFDNPPIGALGRGFGFSVDEVAAPAGAFADGMRDSGVVPTFKHFPGLGHVSANTDTASGVTDRVVTPTSDDLAIYARVLPGGPAMVMLSSAIYAQIDPAAPAVYSPTVVGLLRGQLGFTGVTISDDLSSAAQVQGDAPADRALKAISAGVDIVLVSADASVFPAMYDAVLAKAQADPAFASQVDAAARRVVTLKASALGAAPAPAASASVAP